MRFPNAPLIVLGQCTLAKAVALVLKAPLLKRSKSANGWNWSNILDLQVEAIRYVLVFNDRLSLSQCIRWHLDARLCPESVARRIGCVVTGLNDEQTTNLSNKDVFGRVAGTTENMGGWDSSLILLPTSEGLAGLVSAVKQTNPLLSNSWSRSFSDAVSLENLSDILIRKNSEFLRERLPTLQSIDWDAICFPLPTHAGNAHKWANQIHKWLNAVSKNETPDWEVGKALFFPLISNKNHTIRNDARPY